MQKLQFCPYSLTLNMKVNLSTNLHWITIDKNVVNMFA